jgi:hypothetical protein
MNSPCCERVYVCVFNFLTSGPILLYKRYAIGRHPDTHYVSKNQ